MHLIGLAASENLLHKLSMFTIRKLEFELKYINGPASKQRCISL